MKLTRFFQVIPLFICCSLLSVPPAAGVTADVNFSGKWSLNEDKSDLGEGRFFAASRLTITQDGNSITIERTRAGRDGEERTTSETVTLDGKENVTETDNRKTTSTAVWSEDQTVLTIKSTMEFSRQGETMEMIRTEVLSLDGEGKVLTIKSGSSSARGESSAILVYDKE